MTLEAFDLTLGSTYFQFNNKFYRQKYGCAMCAAISLVVAQLAMEDLEGYVIKTNKLNLSCITAAQIGNENHILPAFNNCHHKIQFTQEIEKNNTIIF